MWGRLGMYLCAGSASHEAKMLAEGEETAIDKLWMREQAAATLQWMLVAHFRRHTNDLW
jgi:hypothetical protein